MYPFFFSFIALLITLWMKTVKLGIELTLIEPRKLRTPEEAVLKLEAILWLFNLSDCKGANYVKNVFDGFYQSLLVKKSKKYREWEIDKNDEDKKSLLSGKQSTLSQDILLQKSQIKVNMVDYMIKNYFEAVKK